MSGSYLDFDGYQALYARYVEGRDIAELMELLGDVRGRTVLDLCGGDGRLSLAALEAGASRVTLVDADPRMVGKEAMRRPGIDIRGDDIHGRLKQYARLGKVFDRAVCRQAVNYWFTEETARLLATVLSEGGVFVFNTFNQEPPVVPRAITYEWGGHSFAEVSWLVGDTVHHVQVREGLPAHATEFRWLSPLRFSELLSPHFSLTVDARAKTSLYRCVRI